MATISIAVFNDKEEIISQGDVFQDVKYNYIDTESDDNVEVLEFTFPMAIIISQACDVNSMGEIIRDQSGKATKFMPSILMCPIYDIDIAKRTEHLDTAFQKLNLKKLDGDSDFMLYKDDVKVSSKDWHYRFHKLTVKCDSKNVLENAIVDFKHYFTVPASYLMKNRDKRIFHLEDLYAEQITLKFSTYLARVAIP